MANSRLCSIPDCDKAAVKRGYCYSHYKRLMRHGDPLAGGPFREPPRLACKVDDCSSPPYGRGYCSRHYKKLKRYGDPLAGRTRMTKAGEPYEWLLAHVDYDGPGCLTWPFGRMSDGRAKLGGGQAYRAMCELVHGPPPSPRHETAHNCGKGHEGCVHPKHVRWDTPLGNQRDRLIHGTHNRGSRNRNCSLSEDEVREIRRLRGNLYQYEIAARFGITQGAVNKIHTGRTWAWLKE